MKLVIEGLKPMYEKIAKSIECQPCDKDRESALCALNEMCRMILCTQTTYDGIPMLQFTMYVENDLRYVSGMMSPSEMEQHEDFHWKLVARMEKLGK